MNTNSNSYTIIYASVMVIIVAFLLAFVSSSLKETQNKNVELDTKKQILAALNITDVKDAEAAYNTYVKGDMLMEADGSLIANNGAFNTTYKGEIAEGRLHVFECEVDGAKKYVIPVYGVYFSHAGETPGLGAEITSPKFQGQFPGKKVFDGANVGLSIVKNGRVANPDYEVDGISGGTITSNGVDAMLKDCLKPYEKFLK